MDRVLSKLPLVVERIFKPFELKQRFRKYSLMFISLLFVAAAISISCLFINQAFDSAEKKDLWGDESMSLEGIQQSSYLDLLVKGPPKQVSPAPLDFMILKIWDQLKGPTQSFGLPDNVYYRLHPIFVSCLSGLMIVLILYFGMMRHTNNYLVLFAQIALLLLALWDYYFRTHNFQFAVEMRAYALWNALWFSIMIFYMHFKRFNFLLFILLISLAGTAIASSFQMSSFILSLIIVSFLDKEKISIIIKTIFKNFSIPFIICLYYIFGKFPQQGADAPNFEGLLFHFYGFWSSTRTIGLIAFLGVCLCSWKGLRGPRVIFLTMLTLYLISPITNYISMSRGLDFRVRYYRYYDLIYPIFFIGCALILPVYLEKIKHCKVVTQKILLKCTLILGISLFISINFFLNYDRHVARSQMINRLMPVSYDYLFDLTRGKKELDKGKLKRYVRYYKKISGYYPNRADAYGMTGFCLYQLGKEGQAISSYEKAMDLNPHFFWYHYNLAMIHLKADRYPQGIQSLKNALKANAGLTLKFIQSSKMIYMPLIAERIEHLGMLEFQLKIDRRNCLELLTLSKQQPSMKLLPSGIKEKIYLKVF